jgi:hypothetical protein
MKKFLRKWLGVEELQRNVKELYSVIEELKGDDCSTPLGELISKEARNAVVEALDTNYSGMGMGMTHTNKYGVKINFRDRLRTYAMDVCSQVSHKQAEEHFKSLIEPEAFIDAIVERIKAKQL